jgi:hypothetical protein
MLHPTEHKAERNKSCIVSSHTSISQRRLYIFHSDKINHLPLLVDGKVVEVCTFRVLLLDLADDGTQVLDILGD